MNYNEYQELCELMIDTALERLARLETVEQVEDFLFELSVIGITSGYTEPLEFIKGIANRKVTFLEKQLAEKKYKLETQKYIGRY
jgi:hypothetical protein